MAQRTIARVYDSYAEAQRVVTDLETAGIPPSDISLVANADAHGRDTGSVVDPADRDDSNAAAGGKRGAVVGGVLGGGAGLLAGIGALAIPGVGPVVAAGWLVATLAGVGVGAASGGLVGSLTGAGMSRDEAHVYAEGVKRGGSLVTVRVDDAEAPRVDALMARGGTPDWQQRRATYGSDWKGFDETAGAPNGVTGTVSPRPLGTDLGTGLPGTDPNRRL